MIGPSGVVRRQALRRAAAVALVDDGRSWTYAELDRAADAHAAALRRAGAAPGDVVAILARNHATFVLELIALDRIGAVSLPLNWRLHAEELRYVCGHAGVALVLADLEFHEKAEGCGRGVVHEEGTTPEGWLSLPALLREAGGDPAIPDAETSEDGVQRVLYTSGTTSRPKGVTHTHGNIDANQVGQILELGLTDADRTMVSAPLFHVSGLEAPGLATLRAGGTMVIARSYRGEDIVRLAARERVTGLVLAAQIVHDILKMPDLADHDLSALRFIVFAGVPEGVRRAVHAALPHVRLIDTFGMTELCNGACYMDAAHTWTKLGSQGTPLPYVELRVAGPDGAALPPGEIGELLVRGRKVSPGYWRDPEATAAAWRDGWFRTGDLASLDAEGYLWFVDRRANMIKSGGENVAAAEIERVLAAHPEVAEVAVIGVPDEKWDEVPKAFVLPREGSAVDEAALRAHCEAHLARFKVPKHFALVSALPRNDSGKVLKRLLTEEG
ncbi:acyl-CoA synthetase (AMP-forming)/AMP-acid ligase II [Actinocorallia herbida]|uniref:Acyl-CoA synthetase (AMP-forming)/AMP-acid ligase II n=1 Tax=Actinocorallia herbida TaxID=58109 RepID=A0A3N1CWY8_9ACTN|nr:AMP-binding protein [Actinocorallia herbida]ROO85807.1 acyl-CoA synthetase (AMP-forming)/AMP-acid ligase II [Actinocorallia herbida]